MLANPVQAIRQVSYDLSLRRPLELDGGGCITASRCSGSTTTGPGARRGPRPGVHR
ncbi:MAG: hypothetical protein R2749_30775 [Acidimicrobiales bacterium]